MMLRNNDMYRSFKPSLKKPIIPAIVLFCVVAIGSAGYYLIWEKQGASIIDAIYMTVITISTVGYLEVHPLDEWGRVFTMFIAVAGIGSLFYLLSVVMENLFIIQLQNYGAKKKMLKKVENLKNHIIVVGFGRVGQLSSMELEKNNEDFVVIDESFPEKISSSKSGNYILLKGKADDDEVLLSAGITKARGMIVTTPDAATTVFVVLSSKVLNPGIFIVARAEDDAVADKLKRAGADRIVNPYSISGQRLANLLINPNVVDFLDTSFGVGENNLKIESIKLSEYSGFDNMSLSELNLRQKYGATIIAVLREQDTFMNPAGDFKLFKNDQLVILGTKGQLKNIESKIIEKS